MADPELDALLASLGIGDTPPANESTGDAELDAMLASLNAPPPPAVPALSEKDRNQKEFDAFWSQLTSGTYQPPTDSLSASLSFDQNAHSTIYGLHAGFAGISNLYESKSAESIVKCLLKYSSEFGFEATLEEKKEGGQVGVPVVLACLDALRRRVVESKANYPLLLALKPSIFTTFSWLAPLMNPSNSRHIQVVSDLVQLLNLYLTEAPVECSQDFVDKELFYNLEFLLAPALFAADYTVFSLGKKLLEKLSSVKNNTQDLTAWIQKNYLLEPTVMKRNLLQKPVTITPSEQTRIQKATGVDPKSEVGKLLVTMACDPENIPIDSLEAKQWDQKTNQKTKSYAIKLFNLIHSSASGSAQLYLPANLASIKAAIVKYSDDEKAVLDANYEDSEKPSVCVPIVAAATRSLKVLLQQDLSKAPNLPSPKLTAFIEVIKLLFGSVFMKYNHNAIVEPLYETLNLLFTSPQAVNKWIEVEGLKDGSAVDEAYSWYPGIWQLMLGEYLLLEKGASGKAASTLKEYMGFTKPFMSLRKRRKEQGFKDWTNFSDEKWFRGMEEEMKKRVDTV